MVEASGRDATKVVVIIFILRVVTVGIALIYLAWGEVVRVDVCLQESQLMSAYSSRWPRVKRAERC